MMSSKFSTIIPLQSMLEDELLAANNKVAWKFTLLSVGPSVFVYLINVLLCVRVCVWGMSAHWLKMIRSPAGYGGAPNHSTCLFHILCQICTKPSVVLWTRVKTFPVVNLPIKKMISLKMSAIIFWRAERVNYTQRYSLNPVLSIR